MGSDRNDEVILFNHWVSPFGQRVHIALVEKGIPFKTVYVDLQNKPEELLEVNPIHGKVPSMKHNGNPVVESLIILEYLDEAWPESWQLLPKNAMERAHARFWADFIYNGFTSMWGTVTAGPDSHEKSAAVEEVRKFAKILDEHMTKCSKEGPFFSGSEFGYLDVILAPLLYWSRVLEKVGKVELPGPEETPRLCQWMRDLAGRKSVKEALPSSDKAIDFCVGVKKMMVAANAAALGALAS